MRVWMMTKAASVLHRFEPAGEWVPLWRPEVNGQLGPLRFMLEGLYTSWAITYGWLDHRPKEGPEGCGFGRLNRDGARALATYRRRTGDRP